MHSTVHMVIRMDHCFVHIRQQLSVTYPLNYEDQRLRPRGIAYR